MQRRRTINSRLADWIRRRAAEEYAGDISLVVIYGSYVNGTSNRMSDVDCYFVPKTLRGRDFSQTFILDGVGYDIFPVSWERLEHLAELKESLIPLLGNGKIIYCDSDDDLERFNGLKDRLKKNLADDNHVRSIAKERCDFAAGLVARLNGTCDVCNMRMLSGYIAMFLADAVALVNHEYYQFGLKRQWDDLCTRFQNVPRRIIDGYRNIAEAEKAETAAECAKKMFEDVCHYVGCTCDIPETVPEEGVREKLSAQDLANLYQEIISTFNKIYVCCENGNHMLAFLSAVCLQHELDDVGFGEYALLEDFDYRNLNGLAAQTKEIEAAFVGYIELNGGNIVRYADFEAFELAHRS